MPSPSDYKLSNVMQEAMQVVMRDNIPPLKVKILLSELTGLTLPELQIRADYVLSEQQTATFSHWMQRLKTHEPVQYITGKAHFYGLVLYVDKNVLIPRPETEGLVEWLCKREKGALRILDIGTGSGAIALAIKNLKPGSAITATDISPAALSVAQANAKRLGLEVVFAEADLFPQTLSRFDVIVSNPPYISLSDFARLGDEIRLFEPQTALLAQEEGLEFYSRILKQSPDYLNEVGKIYLEIGEMQSGAVSKFAVEAGFSKVEVKRDLAGRNRYLCAGL
jgi:release factor glutamine methyltransferase